MAFTKDEIAVLARKEPIQVTFTKANGETRVMNCTLKHDLLPEQTDLEEHVAKRPENPTVLAVWDLDLKAWRSFRIDSVQKVTEAA